MKDKGYIALISILIISALVVLLSTTASIFGIAESDLGLQERQSWESFYLSSACVEEALMRLKEDLEYSGGDILTLSNGTCEILPLIGTGNEDRIIKVVAEVNNQVRKFKVEINRVNPETNINSWSEVANF